MTLPAHVRDGILRRLAPLTPVVRQRMAAVVCHLRDHGGAEVVFVGDTEAEFTLRVEEPDLGILAGAEAARYLRPWGAFPGEGPLPDLTAEALRDLVLDWLADCWRGAGGFNLPLASVRVVDASIPGEGHELWARG